MRLSTHVAPLVWGVFLFVVFSLSAPVAQAQAPAWQRAFALDPNQASNGNVRVESSAVDASGNVFVVGGFSGTVTIGSFVLTTGSSYGQNGFVAKWSPVTQSFLWVQQVGKSGEGAKVTTIAVNEDRVYIVGQFESMTLQVGTTTLTNARGEYADLFFAKITDAGSSSSIVWAQRAGGPDSELPLGIAVQGFNIYVTGAFLGQSGMYGSTSLSSAGRFDAFVTKLTDTGSNGNFVWAQRIGSNESEAAYSVVVQGSSVFISGIFLSQAVQFGSTTLLNSTQGPTPVSDGFVAKLTDAGSTASFVWALKIGGGEGDGIYTAALNGSDLYVGGAFAGPTISIGNTVLTNANTSGTSQDGFITKLTDTGSGPIVGWAQALGGQATDAVWALKVNGSDVYAAGNFTTTTAAPTAAFGPYTLMGAGAPICL
ncbi:hypothetical protein [Hymenobacter cellulosilyticus]|uniref:Uncharacterized protein n=1 Tax=Hymenobacter cellulosilyticus TaxID=2932248 RepID=A0A8T9QDZ2_9BACT|nr:hypothetical protein [Hymenobacter cellulosilyticus]UOQ75112.1 hypothetical protein MUN79_28985 [Hymenobacter cellulosilyticus]